MSDRYPEEILLHLIFPSAHLNIQHRHDLLCFTVMPDDPVHCLWDKVQYQVEVHLILLWGDRKCGDIRMMSLHQHITCMLPVATAPLVRQAHSSRSCILLPASPYAVTLCIQCTLLTTSSTPYLQMYLFMYIHNDSRVSTGGQQEDK